MDKMPSFPVTIHCITYNHASFIEDAMNGFAMQQTTFPFLAIIIDDASTDGEPRVLETYYNSNFELSKYSEGNIWETDEAKFLFGYHKENQNCYFAIVLLKSNYYSQGKSKKHLFEMWERQTKFIALCEGDDYWTSSDKLQKQIDFLESHADYTMCFHRAIEHWEDRTKEDKVFTEVEDRDYSGLDIFDKWTVPTASVVLLKKVYKSSIYLKAINNEKFYYGDIIIFLSCCKCGKVRGFSNVMSVYRRHTGSMSLPQQHSWEQQAKLAYHYLEIYHVFGKEFKKSAVRDFYDLGIMPFFYLRSKGMPYYYLLFDLIRYAPMKTFGLLIKRQISRLKKLQSFAKFINNSFMFWLTFLIWV